MDIPLFLLTTSLLVLVLIGAPIAVALGLPSICYIFFKGLPMELGVQRMFNGMDQFLLLAIPLFMFAGEIMNVGGLTTRLVDLSYALVGRLRGSLAQVSLVSNMFMAGISGSSMADASALGTLFIPQMGERGYPKAFAAAVIAAGAIVGPIIPPSVVFILYAVLADVSVLDLFLAGVFPGILIILADMVYVHFAAPRKQFPKGGRVPLKDALAALVRAIPISLIPVGLIGGLLAGIFTPIEGAGATVLYAALLSMLYKEISVRSVIQSSVQVGRTISEVLLIVGSASLLSWILVSEEVPLRVGQAILSVSKNPALILVFINVILLIAGMFLDGFSVLIIFVPIFKPLAYSIGVDPIHLGIIMCVNIQIGIITPPVGLNLFITTKIANVPFASAAREVLPFIFASIAALILITYIPAISVTLPRAFK